MAKNDWSPPFQICEGFLPADLATAAQSGDWVNLENYQHCLVCLYKGVGAVAELATLTLQQATDAAGTGAKALNFERIYSKQAATNLQTTGQYSPVVQVATNTYSQATNGDNAALWIVPISAEMMDWFAGFKFLRGTVADVGVTAQLACLFYILLTKPLARAAALKSCLV